MMWRASQDRNGDVTWVLDRKEQMEIGLFRTLSFIAISENVKTEGRRHTVSEQSKGGRERERSFLD